MKPKPPNKFLDLPDEPDIPDPEPDLSAKRIHISLPTAFVEVIDMAALDNLMNRSDFIRTALMDKLEFYNLDGSRVRDPDEDPDEKWQAFMDSLYGH